jgi:hypothetical protein
MNTANQMAANESEIFKRGSVIAPRAWIGVQKLCTHFVSDEPPEP